METTGVVVNTTIEKSPALQEIEKQFRILEILDSKDDNKIKKAETFLLKIPNYRINIYKQTISFYLKMGNSRQKEIAEALFKRFKKANFIA